MRQFGAGVPVGVGTRVDGRGERPRSGTEAVKRVSANPESEFFVVLAR